MAARFPVSATAVAYQIKAAWASKILVVYWPAGADALHRLRPGDAVSTVLTRAASGATYNATEGRLEGTSTTYFNDSIAGGYGGLAEKDNFTAGVAAYGDLYNSVTATTSLASNAPPDTFDNGFRLRAAAQAKWTLQNGATRDVPNLADDVAAVSSSAMRHNQSDPTNKLRTWTNGVEGAGSTANPSSTSKIGDTGRPLYIGGTNTGTGNSKWWFEAAWLGVGTLSDAEMVSLTNDPSQIIEVASSPHDLAGAALFAGVTAAGSMSSATILLSGTATLAGFSAAGSMAPAGVRDLAGAAVFAGLSAAGSMARQPGVITSPPLKNNTGTVLASVTGIVVNVYSATTGALVVRKTGLSSNGAGVVVISDLALMPGTSYVYEVDLSAASLGRRLPVGVAA